LENKSIKKISVLSLCLIITTLAVIFFDRPNLRSKNKSLAIALKSFKAWKQKQSAFFMSEELSKTLNFDDYLNHFYSNDSDNIALYVGYYHSSEKTEDVHDPLVCFPGQGWEIKKRRKGRLLIDNNMEAAVSYVELQVMKGNQKQRIIYWYQAYDKTFQYSFTQKIYLLLKKLQKKPADNAFVRISVVEDDKILYESSRLFEFIADFYPAFNEYIING
jgi:EpsI family protein